MIKLLLKKSSSSKVAELLLFKARAKYKKIIEYDNIEWSRISRQYHIMSNEINFKTNTQ